MTTNPNSFFNELQNAQNEIERGEAIRKWIADNRATEITVLYTPNEEPDYSQAQLTLDGLIAALQRLREQVGGDTVVNVTYFTGGPSENNPA
jgi:hypothetical protein